MTDSKASTSTPKIMDIFTNKLSDSPQSTKRLCSQLSPTDDDQQPKKANIIPGENDNDIPTNYVQLLDPLLIQFKSLRESVDNKVGSLENAIHQQRKEVSDELHKIDCSLNRHKEEITQQLHCEIQSNKDDIQ